MSTILFSQLLTKLAVHDKNGANFSILISKKNTAGLIALYSLMKDYQTKIQRNPTAYKSSRIFIYLIFQKICLQTAFLLASPAARSPEKDLVHQNLGKP